MAHHAQEPRRPCSYTRSLDLEVPREDTAACPDPGTRCVAGLPGLGAEPRRIALGSYARLLTRLAKLDLLAIDDWMIAPLRDAERRDLTEVIEDRAERASTLIASQLPVTSTQEIIPTCESHLSRCRGT